MPEVPEVREQARSALERAYTDAIEHSHDVDETRARLLDAAYELFCRLGIQRTSMVDTDLIAELMLRISASFLTVPSRIVDISDDDQLATVARQFLVPMLGTRR